MRISVFSFLYLPFTCCQHGEPNCQRIRLMHRICISLLINPFFCRFWWNSKVFGGLLRPLPQLVVVPARRVELRWPGSCTVQPLRIVHRGDDQPDKHQVQHSNGGGQVGSLRTYFYKGYFISGFPSVCSAWSLQPRSLVEGFAKVVRLGERSRVALSLWRSFCAREARK